MESWNKEKPYRIIAAYDSETNNICDMAKNVAAYPVTHQFGFVDEAQDLTALDAGNVEELVSVEIFRHTEDAYAMLDALIMYGKTANKPFVPVVMVHNLGFDMWALSDYLNRYEVKPLAKSNRKPITFTILDDNGKPALVLWDTLGFYLKPLATMGNECGYPKLVGSWNYDLQRTPETPLTEQELAYAKHDIYVLFAYLGYYLRQNPAIKPERLAKHVMTKTGAVREKRTVYFDGMQGDGLRCNVGRFWHYQNRKELPKSDDEMFTMHACTRGGFTFCAGRWAGVPFDLPEDEVIAGYDATSQHPAQMVSHFYPEDFEPATPDVLQVEAQTICSTGSKWVLEHWAKPFPVAFNGCFVFENLRMRKGTIFERNQISPLAWARTRNIPMAINEDNQQHSEFLNEITRLGYKDVVDDATYSFGKLFGAKVAYLWLTELAMWEVSQVFEWDSMRAVSGYHTHRFCRPSDMTTLSVMHFYDAKNTIKHYKGLYDRREPLGDTSELRKYVPGPLADAMEDGTANDSEVANIYQISKADLNSLFGIECTNESKQDMVLTGRGIETIGIAGIENLPKNPKADYQMGQRIVGWSRIAQIIVMLLAQPYVKAVVNGDTDSVKFHILLKDCGKLDRALERYANAIDKARHVVTSRIARAYPSQFVDLSGIGHYDCEFKVRRFAAAWNKAYCMQEYDKKFKKERFHFTIAGITTNRDYVGFDDERICNSYNAFGDYLYEHGWSFAEVCNLLIGFNVTVDASITKINGRKAPEWGSYYIGDVRDYLGNVAHVNEPAAMALFPMAKTIGGTDTEDNAINAAISKGNNPNINTDSVLLVWEPGERPRMISTEF